MKIKEGKNASRHRFWQSWVLLSTAMSAVLALSAQITATDPER